LHQTAVEAVEHNLRESIRGFERAFRDFQQVETGHQLASWRDLLRLNIQHVTEAERHYTNGQATASCVSVVGGLSFGLHANIERFQTDLLAEPSLMAHALVLVATELEARDLAARWLGTVKEEDVPVLVEGKPHTMKWRTWGAVRAPHGSRGPATHRRRPFGVD
jgi:hypothetical protein